MNKLRVSALLLAGSVAASSFAAPVHAAAVSVTDLEQQAEDMVNQNVVQSSKGETKDSESGEYGGDDSDMQANKADISGSEATSYEKVEINSMEDFKKLVKNCHYDGWSRDKEVILNTDLDFANEEFTPIESFGGKFNGKGHRLSGVSITGNVSETGVFGTIQNTGTVSGLKVQGVISPNGNQTKLGGIAGLNYGKIQNCSFDGQISADSEIGGIVGRNGRYGTVSGCSSTGAITGTSASGGIVGYNEGTVLSCTNGISVNTTYQDSNLTLDQLTSTVDKILTTGDLTSFENLEINSDTGGIAGFTSGVIASCTNEAEIGYEHVGYNVGGIAGRNSGFLQKNTNNAAVYGRKDVGGIVGQMQPYLSVDFAQSTLDDLDSQLDQLNSLVNTGLDNVGSYSANTRNHLTNINGLSKIAQDSTKGLADEGSDQYDEAAGKINKAMGTIQSSLNTFSDIATKLGGYLENAKSSLSSLGTSMSSYIDGINLTSEDRNAMETYIKQFEDGVDQVADGVQKLSDAVAEGPNVSDMGNTRNQDQVRSNVSDALNEISEGYQEMSSAVDGMSSVLEKYPEDENAQEALDRLQETRDTLDSLNNEIGDAQSSLSVLKDSSSIEAFKDGDFSAGDLQDLAADLREQQAKLLENYPELDDAEVAGKSDDELKEYFQEKYGFSDEDAQAYTDHYIKYRDEYKTVTDNIAKLDSAAADIWTDPDAFEQWVKDNDIEGVIQDITDGLGDQGSSLSEMLKIAEKYGKNAANISGVAESLRSAANTLKDSPDVSSELSGALNALASMDLKLNGISDTMRSNANNLYDAMSQLTDEMQSLSDAMSSESEEGLENLRAITDQFDTIMRTLRDAADDLQNTDDNNGVQDVSDEDVSHTHQGRATACTNYGEVSGDTNAGGITGMIGVEYDLDPETDIHQSGDSSLDYIFRAKCIVDNCTNRGTIKARSNYSGGIAGHMEMGLVAENANYGTLDCSGSYVGGITGYSVGVARDNTAKCDVSGVKYVGGIAGYGVTLRNNLAMVGASDSKQYVGAIAGRVKNVDPDQVSGNYYYSTSIYGIDGVSYEGIAEGVTYDALLEKDNIPESFHQLVLTFRADDTIVRQIVCSYGTAIPEDQIPQVPPKEGFHAEWSRTDFSKITEDEVIEANYSRINTLLVSHQERSVGQPVIEVYGNFRDEDALVLTQMTAESGEKERWMVSIPDDGQEKHQIRFLASDDTRNPEIYLIQNGKKTKAVTDTLGKYITFDAEGNDVAFCVEEKGVAGGIAGKIGIAVVMAGAAAVLLHGILKKKQNRKKAKLRSRNQKGGGNGDNFDESEWLDDEVSTGGQ